MSSKDVASVGCLLYFFSALVASIHGRLCHGADTTQCWVEQPLDHFNATDKRTFKQRFYIDNSTAKPGAPIYLALSLFDISNPSKLPLRLQTELASKSNGTVIAPELRYFGQSIPVKLTDSSSYVYMTTEQVLADLESLIKNLKREEQYKSSRVVVFGFDVTGSFAVWLKKRHPELVDVAVAESAALLAAPNMYQYIQLVASNLYAFGGPDCVTDGMILFQHIDEGLISDSSSKRLEKKLNVCNDTDFLKPLDRHYLKYAKLINPVLGGTYISSGNVKFFCSDMFNKPANSTCVSYSFEKFADRLKRDPFTPLWHLWCTEYGQFWSSQDLSLFTKRFPVEFFYETCKAVFGAGHGKERVVAGTKWTNRRFGGLNPGVDNVVYIGAEADPYLAYMVTEPYSENVRVFIDKDLVRSEYLQSKYSIPKLDEKVVKAIEGFLSG